MFVINQNIIDVNREVILSAIEQILYKGGKGNFVIFNLNSDFFIQMAAGRGDYEIYCEAISDNYLDEGKLLTKALDQDSMFYISLKFRPDPK